MHLLYDLPFELQQSILEVAFMQLLHQEPSAPLLDQCPFSHLYRQRIHSCCCTVCVYKARVGWLELQRLPLRKYVLELRVLGTLYL